MMVNETDQADRHEHTRPMGFFWLAYARLFNHIMSRNQAWAPFLDPVLFSQSDGLL